MFPLIRPKLPLFLMLSLLSFSCSDTVTMIDAGSQLDSGNTNAPADASIQDSSSMPIQDASNNPGTDAGSQGNSDSANLTDASSGSADAGSIPMGSIIVPGSHVVAGGYRISLGETYSSVRSKIGMGTQSSAAGNRSKQYTLGADGEVTIWFANTGINADPATNIDDKDQVLWIAVTSGFSGQTPDGLGMGSAQQAVEAVYGVSPKMTPTTNPAPGTIATYYTRGLLVGYNASNAVRTITVCKQYPVEPNGQLDLANGEMTVGGVTLRGATLIGGTGESTIRSTLGDPADAEGTRNLGITSLEILSYAFLGFEMFLTSRGSLMFMTVHTPFYGTSNGAATINATKTDFESHLAAEDFRAGQVSSTSASVTCYQHRMTNKYIGVSYSGMPETVSSITLAMPSTACN